MGAHVKGKNDISLGVCLIGRNQFTKINFFPRKILRKWKSLYPKAKIVGHCDTGNTENMSKFRCYYLV